MTKISLTAGQKSGNNKNQTINNNNEQSFKNGDCCDIGSNISSTKYLSFSVTQKIIHQLLTCKRAVQVAELHPQFTIEELSEKLNIKPAQLRRLYTSRVFHKQLISKINLSLVKLYCSTKLQDAEQHNHLKSNKTKGEL